MTRRYAQWSVAEIAVLRRMYANHPTAAIAAKLDRAPSHVYAKAAKLGLRKSKEYFASPAACRMQPGHARGAAFRFQKGHVPANKGLRRPGWKRGRMDANWFKKGQFPFNLDPDFYVLGALRVNADGYIDIRISFELGAKGWRGLHRVLWEDAHGPVPAGFCLRFKDGDKLNVELANLELIARADLMRRNTVHNLPQPLRSTIHVLGQLKRRIREKQNRGSPQSPVRNP